MIILLIGWSVIAFVWWLIALFVLARAKQQGASAASKPHPSLSIFKPLPPMQDECERALIGDAVESFVKQLSANDQLIVGVNIDDKTAWQPVLDRWQASAQSGVIHIISRSLPAQCANPKVAWLQVMAAEAKGELWLWSDADVVAPPGLVDDMCAELLKGSDQAVSAPYCIHRIENAREVLDAVFVNLEFLPGALLLGRLGCKDYAYGAATVFHATTFHEHGDWRALGASLADDHKLGELLQPVALGRRMVATFTHPISWLAAWEHYYRWQKTVRWCQPGGYAALLVLMPVWGWSLARLFGVELCVQLAGLGGVLVGEILTASIACRLVGCRLPVRSWFGVLLWPFTRPVVWLLVWLPLPVLWSGRRREWFSPEEE